MKTVREDLMDAIKLYRTRKTEGSEMYAKIGDYRRAMEFKIQAEASQDIAFFIHGALEHHGL